MAANMHNDYADRKNGRKPVEYLHEDAQDVLGDTYGLMIFQESVMRVAQKFAGYSLAEADNLRKACGKKIREMIRKEREKFVAGCDQMGYGIELGNEWFDIIEPFADYAFPKAHAYGYGLVAYQTAYLKANYPVEYLACLLTSVKQNLDKAAIYLNECRVIGVPVLVPDVNKSDSDFIAVFDPDTGQGSIPFGLSAVRNVGEGLVHPIVREREENGPFTDFYDFCERVDSNVLNKRAVESLDQGRRVRLDGPSAPRPARRARGDHRSHDGPPSQGGRRPVRVVRAPPTSAAAGFDDARIEIPDLEFEKRQRLAFEKEMLGLYVSDHPLMGAEASLRRRTECVLTELEEAPDGAIRVVGGLVTNLQRKWTKRGDLMAVFQLEDLQTSIEVMVFPKTMQKFGHVLDRRRRGDHERPRRHPRRSAQAHGHRARTVRADGRRRAAHPHQPVTQRAERAPARRPQVAAARAPGRLAGVPAPR